MANEEMDPLELISSLPVSPPDPVGAAIWHSAEENKGDLLIKGDRGIERLKEAQELQELTDEEIEKKARQKPKEVSGEITQEKGRFTRARGR